MQKVNTDVLERSKIMPRRISKGNIRNIRQQGMPQVVGFDTPELRARALRQAIDGLLGFNEIPQSVPDEYKALFSMEFRNMLAKSLMESHNKGERAGELLRTLELQNINDDEWAMENNTAFKGINTLRKALDNSEDSVQAIKNVNKALPQIKTEDTVLYRLILEKALNPTEAALLTRLKILTQSKDVMNVIAEFENYGSRDATLATGMDDAKLGNEIQALVNYMDNLSKSVVVDKLNYLRTTETKTKTWLGNPNDFNVYHELVQQIIRELGTKYKDVRLAEEIANSNEVKHLLHYDEEVIYFKSLLSEVEQGVQEADWGLFLNEFYKKLKSEEAHIKQFGDSTNAGAMEEVKKKYGQYPKMWISMLDGAVRMLNDPRKKKEAIIAARERIKVIVAAKIKEIKEILRKHIRKPLKKIHSMVSSKLRDISDAKRVYYSITQQRDRILKRGLKVVRREFAKRDAELTDLINETADESIALRSEWKRILRMLARIDKGKVQQAAYDIKNRRMIMESRPIDAVPRLHMTSMVLVHLERLAENEKRLLEEALTKMREVPTRLDAIGKKNEQTIFIVENLLRVMKSRQFVINREGV